MELKFLFLVLLGSRELHSVARGSWLSCCSFVNLSCAGRPCFSYSDRFLFCWAAFLSISLANDNCLSSSLFSTHLLGILSIDKKKKKKKFLRYWLHEN